MEGRRLAGRQAGREAGREAGGGCSEALGGLPDGREGEAGMLPGGQASSQHRGTHGRWGGTDTERQSKAALRDRGFRGVSQLSPGGRKTPRGGQVQSSRLGDGGERIRGNKSRGVQRGV